MLAKYFDYADIYFFDLVMELPKNKRIKKYAIKLVEGKQLVYALIYSFSSMKLETLKVYIKIHLKT